MSAAGAALLVVLRGGLAVGMDADLLVLDRDLLEVDPSAIIGTSASLTIMGGRIVHRSEGAS